MGIAAALAACITDPRDQNRVIHDLDDILRARMLAIACGYEDADDLDALRHDPGFKLALGKLPVAAAGRATHEAVFGAQVEQAVASRVQFMAEIWGVDRSPAGVHGGIRLQPGNGRFDVDLLLARSHANNQSVTAATLGFNVGTR